MPSDGAAIEQNVLALDNASQIDNMMNTGDEPHVGLKRWQSDENAGIWASMQSPFLHKKLQDSTTTSIDSPGLIKSISCYLEVSEKARTRTDEFEGANGDFYHKKH